MNPLKHLARVGKKLTESQQIMQQVYLEFHLIEDFKGVHLGLLREMIEFHSMIWDRMFELACQTDVRKYSELTCPGENDTKEWFPYKEGCRFYKNQETEIQEIDNQQAKALYRKLKGITVSTGEVDLSLSETELTFIIKAIEEKVEIE